jgi:hypothetical protein
MTATTSSFNALMKDLYPIPGERIKQWVVDQRRERDWTVATCPRVEVPPHIDNCTPDGYSYELDAEYGPPIGGYIPCRNVGSTIWADLDHDSCYVCGDLHVATRARPDIAAWLEVQAARPRCCTDRSQLSDEIAPNLALADSPVLALLRSRRRR